MVNTNAETGIRFGIISANSLDYYLVDEIQERGVDVGLLDAIEDVKLTVQHEIDHGQGLAEDFDQIVEHRVQEMLDEWVDVEPIHTFEIDGVTGRTTWLGGSLHVWIFHSPHIGKFKQASPCVPNAADLDNPDNDGVEGYDVPEDWRAKCTSS